MISTTPEQPILENIINDDTRMPFNIGFDDLRWTKSTVQYNWHEDIEILCCHTGKGIIRCNGKDFELSKGDVCLIGSMVIHAAIPLTDDFTFYGTIVKKDFCVANSIGTDKLPLTGMFHNETIAELLEKANAARKKKAPLYDVQCRMYVLGILHQAYQPVNGLVAMGRSCNTAEHVQRTFAYIDESYGNKITLEDIAKEIGVTTFHLTRIFKKMTGTTIFEYLNTIRCQQAKLRIDSGYPVSKAALECGFRDMSYFSKVYKKIYGVAPSRTVNH